MKTSIFGSVICTLLLLLPGCNGSGDNLKYEPPVFKEIIKAEAELLFPNDEFIHDQVQYMGVVDSLLIIQCKTINNEHRFHIFNKYTKTYIKSFGLLGQGPGELILPISRVSLDEVTKTLYASSNSQNKIVKFPIPEIIHQDRTIFDETIINVITNYLYVYHVKSDIFLGGYLGFKYRFGLIKDGTEKDTIAGYNQYPPIPKEEENGEEVRRPFFLYRSSVAVKPDGSKFVNVTQCGLIMEIFNIADNKILPESIHRYYKPNYTYNKKSKYVNLDKSEMDTYFTRATDKYIYVILIDDSNGKSPNSTLAVFDWSGMPVKQYVVDHRMTNFCIDEEDGKVYALATKDGSRYFISFKL